MPLAPRQRPQRRRHPVLASLNTARTPVAPPLDDAGPPIGLRPYQLGILLKLIEPCLLLIDVNVNGGFSTVFTSFPVERNHYRFSTMSAESSSLAGSGKATLLLPLAGKLGKDLKFSGRVTYNGHGMEEFVPQRTSAYISQYDLHIGEMTVREILAFSAKCQGARPCYGEHISTSEYKLLQNGFIRIW
ncbi:ABC transporter G family member 3-like [Eucalyptus grandis]|uniref:ABC transporter G family member 3-like n=1 Tax=Eucalyptus grandis TaxID=71139 RepID=UPI00192EA03D|nr:ABC transporter G family member 3-like [Eucalyptus grandis]